MINPDKVHIVWSINNCHVGGLQQRNTTGILFNRRKISTFRMMEKKQHFRELGIILDLSL